jgi:hypothetical protein
MTDVGPGRYLNEVAAMATSIHSPKIAIGTGPKSSDVRKVRSNINSKWDSSYRKLNLKGQS